MGYNVNQAIEKLKTYQAELDDGPGTSAIQEVLNLLDNPDVIFIEWSIEDVLCQAANDDCSLTEADAREVLYRLEQRHDASIGINWDVISALLHYNREVPV